ncbi:LuxR C-terminal-related transcriptional regulator [Roseivirga sp.]|uniref:LuxR C-terminal-related transcriptional regulator n=1 Tax=Roseivirga sp. TaxID=1964215 RepID=UPI003B52CFED
MRFKALLVILVCLFSLHLSAQDKDTAKQRPSHIDEETWERIQENRSETPEEEERRFLTNRIMMRDVGITLLATIGIVVFIAINTKNSRQRNSKKLRMYRMRSTQAEMRSIELKNELIRSELSSKEKRMNELLEVIRQKNQKLEELNSKLTDKEKMEKADVLSSVSEAFNSEVEWENFRTSFEQIHSGFFDKILSIHPALTAYELRLCALLRLNLSSKEIGSILNISASSVNTGRYRMRKKMNLTETDDLVRYLMTV